MDDPGWPEGETEFNVRLFAERRETVMEQLLLMNLDETGRLGIHWGLAWNGGG